MARILLFRNTASSGEIFLEGPRDAGTGEFTAEVLIVQAPNAVPIDYHLPPDIRIGADWQASTGTTGDYVLQRAMGDVVLQLTVPLVGSGGDLAFLGRNFSAEAGYTIQLNVLVTGTGRDMPDAYCSVHACGIVDAAIDGGGMAAFLDAKICCELSFPSLPVLPNFSLPRARIRLPDIGFDWPDFDLPFGGDFPQLPTLPWNFGWPALEWPSLFLKLSWRSVAFTHGSAGTSVDIIGLRLEGPAGRTLEADLHVVVKGGLVTTDSWLEYYPKDSGHSTRLAIAHWYRSDECLAIGWKGRQLENWLGLLLPEFLVPDLNDECDIVLRLLHEAGNLTEVRLDYTPPLNATQALDITLPGFIATFPRPEFYSFVAWQAAPLEEDVQWRLGLLATLPRNATLTGHTTFTGGSTDARRLHGDDSTGSDRLAELAVTIQSERLSLAAVDLPLGSGRPSFFRKADIGIEAIDWANPETLEWRAVDRLASLTDADVDATFKLNASQLPFLKQGGMASLKQYIEVTPGNGRIDFVARQVAVPLGIKLHLGDSMQIDAISTSDLLFNWEDFAFDLSAINTIDFTARQTLQTEFLGLSWRFENAPNGGPLFQLELNGENFALRQAQGARIEARFTRITSASEPLVFTVDNFALGPRGLNIDARMQRCHARLNGVATRFEFQEASFQVRDNKITGFTISGGGALPPALVGEASADIALQFGSDADGKIALLSAGAALKGRNLLRCQGTRFELTIDGLGLRFVNEKGDYHLYFTLTGMARFRPIPSDDGEGPLAWLPTIEMQFVDCPLAGDGSVLKRHIQFNVEMPRKIAFEFLGCFSFELRGLGFIPEVDFWPDKPAAMLLSGQIKFAVDGGDVIDARFDFHNCYVAVPEPGSFLPRLRCRDLGLRLRVGEAFDIEGRVDFLDGEEIEPGWRARGFRGQGAITIMGLPKFAASFAFLRVLQSTPSPRWVRAWFIYTEVRHLSLRIPAPIPLFIREVGLGFGYRYTLATLKSADELDDIKTLIRELNRLAASQGNLSDFSSWRVDIETPPAPPRWTLATRGMIATSSASSGAMDWHPAEEKALPNIVLLDAVMGLRSDFTFYVNVRSWLFTNYRDFDDDVNGVRTHPLHTGYALFQPRKQRLLAHVGSSPNPQFGDHPPLWEFMKQAMRSTHYSATLLIEPGLFHVELGWPNVLRWGMKWGPFNAECRGGALFRITRREMVQGLSFEARGNLNLRAEFNAGPVGARLWAEARMSFGARYIFVLGLDRIDRTAFYGAVGLELRVDVGIAVWIKIELLFCTITLDFSFSFQLGLSALLEVGANLTAAPGCRGTADVSVQLCGHGLHFHIHVGINEKAVDRAYQIAQGFLNVGLEATEVEPLPGESLVRPKGAAVLEAAAVAAVPSARLRAAASTASPGGFVQPDYDIITVPSVDAAGQPEWLLVLIPSAETVGGFVSTPPKDGLNRTQDYEWDLNAHADPSFKDQVERFVTIEPSQSEPPAELEPPQAGVFKWRVAWQMVVGHSRPQAAPPSESDAQNYFNQLLRHAFMPKDFAKPVTALGDVEPNEDPAPIEIEKGEGDDRIRNPSDQNYEAAVRGAMEQFEGSPYLKHDLSSDYERKLIEACRETTSIYTKDDATTENDEARHRRQAIELRSTILNGLIEDVKKYAEMRARDEPADDRRKFREKSAAFILGLVFRTDREPPWLTADGEQSAKVGKIRQCADVETPIANGEKRSVKAYNTRATSFFHHPPRLDDMRHYASASTVAMAWDLEWDNYSSEPEDHLRHYRVVRQPLGFTGADKEFFVKPAAILLRVADNKAVSLPPRFQFVDHFEDESDEDIANLPLDGLTYLYTITPVDLAGQASPRSFAKAATRRPNRPPRTPVGASLTVHYNLDKPSGVSEPPLKLFEPTSDPRPLVPAALRIALPEPPPPDDPAFVPTNSWRLVLRRERTLPIGSYPTDAGTDSPRRAAPASMARTLPSDIKIDLPSISEDPEENIFKTKDGRFIVWTIADLNTLPDLASVFPTTPGAEWQPGAWRVFLQAESHHGVFSSLSPVELTLQFGKEAIGEFGRPPAGCETRHPELLEWILRPLKLDFLPEREGQADADFAMVPRPQATADDRLVRFNLDTVTDDFGQQPLAFQTHPKKWRAARLRWNHTPASADAKLRELAAGYGIFEFDVDEYTATATPERMLERMREVRQMRLLPANQGALVPSDNLAPDTWEAWYPSSARREFIRARQSAPEQNGRGIDQWLSPWFSWRDSYLEWPAIPAGWEQLRLYGNTPVSIASTAATIKVANGKVTIELSRPDDLGGDEFKRRIVLLATCSWLEVSGLGTTSQNGVKPVIRHDVTTAAFEFPEQCFPGLAARNEAAVVLAQPRADVHWFLEFLVGQIEVEANMGLNPEAARFFGVAADPSLAPPGKAKNIEGFRIETSAGQDPYGWNTLKRLGLSCAVVFRHIRTGEPLPTTDVWRHLQKVLVKTKALAEILGVADLLPHLHVEFLFQPGRSVRLKSAPDVRPSVEDDLLALLQLSLRPRICQDMGYSRYTLELDSTAEVKVDIKTKAGSQGPISYVVEGSGRTGTRPPTESVTLACSAQAGDDGEKPAIRILMRHARNEEPEVVSAQAAFARVALPPTSWEAVRFADLTQRWYQVSNHVEPLLAAADAQWHKLVAYLRAAGVAEPADTDEFQRQLNVPGTLDWLRRFFNFSEDFTRAASDQFPSRGDGPWIATAYPQSNTQLYATPLAGRLEAYQLIDDGWGHAFRYFARPAGRYDQLWLGLAQSNQLYPKDEERWTYIASLQKLEPPPTDGGGLDVTLPRIRRLAPPLVLGSRRLDQPDATGFIDPSPTWEVIVAKHLEQQLSERNRSLAQRLEFQHVAWTMLRRFAFPELRRNREGIDPIAAQYDGQLPQLIPPDTIDVPMAGTGSIDERQRSLLLPDRLDPFARDAVALQWRCLPFFYEHRLLLMAQAGHAVSPVVAVTQRDFTFRSPPGIPVTDASIVTKNGEKWIEVDIRLARLWDSLPEEPRKQWAIEDPDATTGSEFRPAGLPDPEVTYELLNSGEQGETTPLPVTDTLAALAFTRDADLAWKVRAVSPRFATDDVEIIHPPAIEGGREHSKGRVRLRPRSTAGAMSTEFVRSRHAFSAMPTSYDLSTPPPGYLGLVWRGPMSAGQEQTLRGWIGRTDASLGAAFNALIVAAQGLGADDTVATTASAGLDQIVEVRDEFKDRLTLEAVATPPTLKWQHYFTAAEKAALEEWLPTTPWRDTIQQLLDMAVAERTVDLTTAATDPGNLPANVVLTGGLKLTKAADILLAPAGLDTLRNPPADWDEPLRVAAQALASALDTLIVEIGDPSFRWRPTDADLAAAGLRDVLMLGRSILRADKWFTLADAKALLDSLMSEPEPVRAAVRRLYAQSRKAAMPAGRLRLRCRRSVANNSPDVPVDFALP